MREKTNSQVIKKNAEKTLAALQRFAKPCRNASAC
jgi:hypothetical protein